jgi:hypothetical protein
MDKHPAAPHTDDTYRALGRYVVEFSRLIFYMRWLIAAEIAGVEDETSHERVEIVLGDATAGPITSAFFALCALEKDWDDEERRIAERLENSVLAEITRRNDYAHGDWWINWGASASNLGPALSRVKPSRRKAPARSWEGVPAGELDARSDALAALRVLVVEFGLITLRTLAPPEIPHEHLPRVRGIFEIEGSRKHGTVRRRPDAPGEAPEVF